MIKFLCDICGKDISEKVRDSVKQFCGRGYFKQDLMPGVMEGTRRQVPDMQDEARHEEERVHLDIQLLDELSKLIHASAWGINTRAIRCSDCAMQHMDLNRGKVVTIFTRIPAEQRAAEMQ